MRNTYASKQTSKPSTHTFLYIKKQNIFRTSKKKNTTPTTNNDSQNNTKTTPTAPQLQSLNHNHPLSLVLRNFRNIALTGLMSSRPNYPQSPIQHLITQQSNIEDTYEQIVEQLYTTKFRSQNNHLFSLR